MQFVLAGLEVQLPRHKESPELLVLAASRLTAENLLVGGQENLLAELAELQVRL